MPQCRAKSKRTGERCRAPAMRGYRVCRMHGACGGGSRKGNYGHGASTKENCPELSSLNRSSDKLAFLLTQANEIPHAADLNDSER
jgi:hypothetical protein